MTKLFNKLTHTQLTQIFHQIRWNLYIGNLCVESIPNKRLHEFLDKETVAYNVGQRIETDTGKYFKRAAKIPDIVTQSFIPHTYCPLCQDKVISFENMVGFMLHKFGQKDTLMFQTYLAQRFTNKDIRKFVANNFKDKEWEWE
jgi:hypothetical protein